MKKSEANKIIAKCKNASKDFDDYNTVVKTHTVKMAGQEMVLDEVRSGHIKLNGTEQFSSYDEMVSCLMDGAEIETVEVK